MEPVEAELQPARELEPKELELKELVDEPQRPVEVVGRRAEVVAQQREQEVQPWAEEEAVAVEAEPSEESSASTHPDFLVRSHPPNPSPEVVRLRIESRRSKAASSPASPAYSDHREIPPFH